MIACLWDYLGLGSMHALAMAACPSRPALAVAAACLGLGSMPMVTCLSIGYCMPWAWLCAHGTTLALVASMHCQRAHGGYLGLGYMLWP
nr:hypothetical protein CFP56_54110 [Quercus suber]